MSKRATKIFALYMGGPAAFSTGGRAFKRLIVDPVQRAMDRAPIDDAPLSEEDIRAIEEAKAENGPFLSSAEVRKALGLA